ncbi:hypothetical protein BJX63DRAFT_419121 [Aspergillus granulosus]|uniref:FAD-binding PCMH-type domain-containing protein n=1 Tax=Aspergillus granulosus TaxID=176169 RepID=A0ABR4HSW0_9EURO
MTVAAEQALASLQHAGLGDVLYLPGSEKYNDRVASHWSATAQLHPWAIVQPRNTNEVAKAVNAIVTAADVKFAVRSGGHMHWAGAAGIADGITIDLGLMNRTSYDAETEIASLGPGGYWGASYKELEKHGRMVAGGREGQVGIAGLLTGGGISYYTCRVGFACDQVINYQVALADGRIINANKDENPDLFMALKGGRNNFGIVTRFDMITFPARNIRNSTITCSKDTSAQVAEALVDFTKKVNTNPGDHLLAIWWHVPRTEEYNIVLDLMNLDGEESSKTHEKINAIPGKRSDFTASVARKLELFVDFSGKQDTWFTLTFKADVRIVLKTVEVFEALIKKMKGSIPDANFSHQLVFQPVPACFRARSFERSANMLGLDHIKEDCIQFVWAIEVETVELNKTVVHPLLKKAAADVEAYARSIGGGDSDFLYLNHCDPTQDPLGAYGEDNIRKMKEVVFLPGTDQYVSGTIERLDR